MLFLLERSEIENNYLLPLLLLLWFFLCKQYIVENWENLLRKMFVNHKIIGVLFLTCSILLSKLLKFSEQTKHLLLKIWKNCLGWTKTISSKLESKGKTTVLKSLKKKLRMMPMMKFIYTKNILRQRFFLLIFSGFSRIFLALYIVIAFNPF